MEGRSHEAFKIVGLISLMKILKEKAPIAYKSAHMTMSKQDAQKLIEKENIFTHFEYFYRQSRVLCLVAYLLLTIQYTLDTRIGYVMHQRIILIYRLKI